MDPILVVGLLFIAFSSGVICSLLWVMYVDKLKRKESDEYKNKSTQG